MASSRSVAEFLKSFFSKIFCSPLVCCFAYGRPVHFVQGIVVSRQCNVDPCCQGCHLPCEIQNGLKLPFFARQGFHATNGSSHGSINIVRCHARGHMAERTYFCAGEWQPFRAHGRLPCRSMFSPTVISSDLQ